MALPSLQEAGDKASTGITAGLLAATMAATGGKSPLLMGAAGLAGKGIGAGIGALTGGRKPGPEGTTEAVDELAENVEQVNVNVTEPKRGVFTQILDVLQDISNLMIRDQTDTRNHRRRTAANDNLARQTANENAIEESRLPGAANAPANTTGSDTPRQTGLAGIFGRAFGNMKGILMGLLSFKVISKLLGAIFSPRAIGKFLWAAFKKLNIILLLGTAIVSGINGFIDEYKKSGSFKEGMIGAVGQIIEAFTFGLITKEDVIDAEKKIDWTKLKDKFVTRIEGWIDSFLGTDETDITNVPGASKAYLAVIEKVYNWVGKKILDITSGFLGMIGFDDAAKDVDTFNDETKLGTSIVTGLKSAVEMYRKFTAWRDGLMKSVTDFQLDIENFFGDARDKTTKFVTDTGQSVVDKKAAMEKWWKNFSFLGEFDKISLKVQSFFTGIRDWVGDKVDLIGNFFKQNYKMPTFDLPSFKFEDPIDGIMETIGLKVMNLDLSSMNFGDVVRDKLPSMIGEPLAPYFQFGDFLKAGLTGIFPNPMGSGVVGSQSFATSTVGNLFSGASSVSPSGKLVNNAGSSGQTMNQISNDNRTNANGGTVVVSAPVSSKSSTVAAQTSNYTMTNTTIDSGESSIGRVNHHKW